MEKKKKDRARGKLLSWLVSSKKKKWFPYIFLVFKKASMIKIFYFVLRGCVTGNVKARVVVAKSWKPSKACWEAKLGVKVKCICWYARET